MTGTATLVDAAMDAWAPDTRHYLTDDGQHLAIHVDAGVNAETVALIDETLAALELPTLDSGKNYTVVVCPTTVVVCGKDGAPLGQFVPEPIYTFDPGTSHVDALALMGYQLT